MGIVKELSEAGFRIKYLTLRNNQLSLQYLHMKGNKLELNWNLVKTYLNNYDTFCWQMHALTWRHVLKGFRSVSPSLAILHASGIYECTSIPLTRSDLELKNIQDSKIKKQGSVNSARLLKAGLKDCLNCNTTLNVSLIIICVSGFNLL